MLKFIRYTPLGWTKTLNYKFASAAAAIDYYSLLGVSPGSTTVQIQDAFAKLTRNVNPDNNLNFFNKITEAFVILSDSKARDAYDSLLKTRKLSYINEAPTTKPMVSSYLADRKAQANKQYSKKYNLDKFGRYRGGVPKPNSTRRGNSMQDTGILYSPSDKIQSDAFPEYTAIDTEKAESFKNYHQNERNYRTMKKTWYSPQVDYQFFTVRKFMDKLSYFKYFVVIIFVLPVITSTMIGLRKRLSKRLADQKNKQKQEKNAKKAGH